MSKVMEASYHPADPRFPVVLTWENDWQKLSRQEAVTLVQDLLTAIMDYDKDRLIDIREAA